MLNHFMRVILISLTAMFSGVSFAQEALFSTLVANGYVVVQRGGNPDTYENLDFGVKLFGGDKIVTTGGEVYIGLISNSGQLVELTEGLVFDVNSIANGLNEKGKVGDAQSEFLGLLEPQFSESSNASSARVRAVTKEEIHWEVPTDFKVIENSLMLRWKDQETAEYKVVVLDMFDEVIYAEKINSNEVELDLVSLNLQNDDVYQVQVFDADNNAINSSKVTLRIPSKEVMEMHKGKISEMNGDAALNNALLAAYFDKNEFYLQAMEHYKKAMQLQPNVGIYKKLYQDYKELHQIAD